MFSFEPGLNQPRVKMLLCLSTLSQKATVGGYQSVIARATGPRCPSVTFLVIKGPKTSNKGQILNFSLTFPRHTSTTLPPPQSVSRLLYKLYLIYPHFPTSGTRGLDGGYQLNIRRISIGHLPDIWWISMMSRMGFVNFTYPDIRRMTIIRRMTGRYPPSGPQVLEASMGSDDSPFPYKGANPH